MLLDEAQNKALRTWKAHEIPQEIQPLTVALMGLSTEAAEAMDILKKFIYAEGGAEIDDMALAKELGDCIWYSLVALREIDYRAGATMAMVFEKLEERHNRDGFSSEHYRRDTEE